MRWNRNRGVLAAVLLLAAVGTSAAQAEERPPRGAAVIPRLTLWSATLGGRIALDEDHLEGFPFIFPITTVTDVKGSGISLGEDGDLDTRAFIPVFEVEIAGESGRNDPAWQEGLRLSYWGHEWSNTATMRGAEAFDGTIFTNGTRVESRLRYDLAGLDYLIHYRVPRAPLILGVDLGLRVVRAEFEMESATGGESERFDGLLFGGAARAEWRPLPVLVVAGSLGAYGLFGDPLAEGSLAVGAEWGPARLDFGYRQLWVDGSGEHEEFRLRLGGPTLALSVRF